MCFSKKQKKVHISQFSLLKDFVFNDTFLRGKKYDCLNIAMLTDLNTQTNAENLEVIIENLTQSGITMQFL